jgi:peptidoglycan/xylan/chitin deacetylase (PgdA/CDA1 family)
MDLEELVARGTRGDLPERAVAITFDDGYEDNYRHAFPLLRKFGLPATIFIASAAVNNRLPLWHDRVFDAFRFAQAKRARLRSWHEFEIVLESEDWARQSLRRFLQRAKYLPCQTRLALVDELEQALDPDACGHPRASMLTWEQMREMQAHGIRFGSHTVTHPILTCVDEQQLRDELFNSKAELEARLAEKVTGFAYPNGKPDDYNEEVKKVLRSACYSWAVTTNLGFNTSHQDRFELKRGQPWEEDVDFFRMRFFLQRHGIAS